MPKSPEIESAKYILDGTLLVMRSLGTTMEAASRLISAMRENSSTRQLANMIMDIASKPENKDAKLLAVEIGPEIAGQLQEICKRDDIAFIPTDLTKADKVPDGLSDLTEVNITGKGGISGKPVVFMYLSTQQEAFNLAKSESLARSGIMSEIDRAFTQNYINKLDDNPMYEIKGMSLEQYEALRKDVQRLSPTMRFTLFPQYKYDGTDKSQITGVDVGFLSKTDQKNIIRNGKESKVGPFSIPDMIKGLLAKEHMIESSMQIEEYTSKIAKSIDIRNSTIEKFCDAEDKSTKYMIPAYCGINEQGENYYIPDTEKFVRTNERDVTFREPGEQDRKYNRSSNNIKNEINEFALSNTTKNNMMVIQVTQKEFDELKRKKGKRISPQELSLLDKENEPEIFSQELRQKEKDANSIIDIINKNNEKFMLASDNYMEMSRGFNGITESFEEVLMGDHDIYSKAKEREEEVKETCIESYQDITNTTIFERVGSTNYIDKMIEEAKEEILESTREETREETRTDQTEEFLFS